MLPLLRDLGSGCRELVIGFTRCIAKPADRRLGRFCGFGETVGAALRFADCDADPVPDLRCELFNAVAKRAGPLGERADRAVLAAGLGGKRVELGARAAE